MADSDLLGDSSRLSAQNVSDVLGSETVLRDACLQFEANIVTWIAEVDVAQTMFDVCCVQPMLEAAEHLARLKNAMRVASDYFQHQLRERLGAVPIEIADRDLLTGLFRMNLRERASARVDHLHRIHKALEAERLVLYCQPIVDLVNNEVSQYELLLRLDIQDGALPLPPSDFLGIAERFGLTQSIDCWVVRKAIALLADRVRTGRPLILHVNVSAKSIGDPEFAAVTEAALAEAAIDPTHLVLELTETGAITNLENAKTFTTRLRKIGCRFALDDFGAGFGSFYNLKYLPFDLLKIDGDFVRNFAAGPVDQLVVNAIVTIARGMGKKTVAEFVESAEMSRLLRESGVDYGQGYYLGRPRPVGEVLFNS